VAGEEKERIEKAGKGQSRTEYITKWRGSGRD